MQWEFKMSIFSLRINIYSIYHSLAREKTFEWNFFPFPRYFSTFPIFSQVVTNFVCVKPHEMRVWVWVKLDDNCRFINFANFHCQERWYTSENTTVKFIFHIFPLLLLGSLIHHLSKMLSLIISLKANWIIVDNWRLQSHWTGNMLYIVVCYPFSIKRTSF